MGKLLVLSLLVVPVFLGTRALAQDVVPVIYLSPDEAANARRYSQALTSAEDRSSQAVTAWRNFYTSYQAEHPELPGLKFAPDFRVALASKDSGNRFPFSKQVATAELSAGERQRAEALYREMTESKLALEGADKNWQDFWHELVASHVGQSHESGWADVQLSNGQSVSIPSPWTNGIYLTPDFRIAVPH